MAPKRRAPLLLPLAALLAHGLVLTSCRRGATAEGTGSADGGLGPGIAVRAPEATLVGPEAETETVAPPSDADAGGRIVITPSMHEVELVGAMNFQTSILSEMDWPPETPESQAKRARRRHGRAPAAPAHVSTSQRLGYLRHGATAPAITIAVPNEACPEGWLELVAGGFVCGKSVTFDLKNPRVTRAPRAPDMAAPLPYGYGAVVAHGTPVYRRVLSRADRAAFEAAPAAKEAKESEGTESEENPYAREIAATREKPTLEELQGRGVLVRKLARGFILALDREFKAADARWWRTTGGFAVPQERIMPMQSVAEPHGHWLAFAQPLVPNVVESDAGLADASAPRFGDGTVAFVKSKMAHEYVVVPSENKVAWGAELPVDSVLELTGPRFAQGGTTYRETTRDFWMRAPDAIIVTPVPPEDLAPGEKWVDVDMTLQTLVAFEGMRPVFAARVSTGRRNAVDHDKDHPTPAGTFRIREKHITATMDGDVASDGPYSIEDVPWVMYFDRSYALHGAFWHNAFGTPRSHGCVNMAPADAKQLFGWVEPRLPDGWHGAYATTTAPGTRVVLHGEAR